MNVLGAYTLYIKEVRRFLKVYNQTLLAPVVTALLFLAVFDLAIGDSVKTVGDLPFQFFMTAGLIMMSAMQNAFANTSSSFTMGKVLGTIIDYLIPPLSPGEIIFSMVMAGITRGIMVGILVGIGVYCFIPFEIHHFFYALLYLIAASALLSLLGLFAGIMAETFDQMSAITSYVITPLAFLSGTFYSVSRLPEFWYQVSQYNPFFYMIDGFRYALTGYHDSNLTAGIWMILGTTIAMTALNYRLLSRGYRVKS